MLFAALAATGDLACGRMPLFGHASRNGEMRAPPCRTVSKRAVFRPERFSLTGYPHSGYCEACRFCYNRTSPDCRIGRMTAGREWHDESSADCRATAPSAGGCRQRKRSSALPRRAVAVRRANAAEASYRCGARPIEKDELMSSVRRTLQTPQGCSWSQADSRR
jgi:hypothetical protein